MSYPKPRAIQKREDFQRVYKNGKKIAYKNVVLIYNKEPSETQNKISVVISAKEGPATKRNRARRLIKEVYRLNQGQIKQGFKLLFIAKSPLLEQHDKVEEIIRWLLKKAGLFIK